MISRTHLHRIAFFQRTTDRKQGQAKALKRENTPHCSFELAYGAAELAAGAILDAKRGDVVGERTFGEGSVQKTIELPDGAALLLTVAKYETPSGKKIEDDAVTPNVAVAEPVAEEDEETPSPKGDEPLTKALDLLKAKSAWGVSGNPRYRKRDSSTSLGTGFRAPALG